MDGMSLASEKKSRKVNPSAHLFIVCVHHPVYVHHMRSEWEKLELHLHLNRAMKLCRWNYFSPGTLMGTNLVVKFPSSLLQLSLSAREEPYLIVLKQPIKPNHPH